MREIWSLGEAKVAALVKAINGKRPDSPIQRGTVHVLLGRLVEKGWIRREKHGRSFIYSALVDAQHGLAEIAHEFRDQVFEGSPVALVQSLVDSRDLKKGDIDQLRALLDEAEHSLKGKPRTKK